jgi:signal transduction histidine kinase
MIREQQFTADASHELRTPLSVIRGTLEVLVRKPRSTPQYEEKIRYCLEEIDRMNQLIDQLLLLARYENERININIQKVDVAGLFENVFQRLENSIRKKNIHLEKEFNFRGHVSTDPEMFDQILENILSNAVKYSEKGGTVVTGIRNDRQSVIITIRDNGQGISEEDSERIFSRFYRTDFSRNSGKSGYGLGLAIVKRLSDLLHIKIDISSKPGTGTTFILTLPYDS